MNEIDALVVMLDKTVAMLRRSELGAGDRRDENWILGYIAGLEWASEMVTELRERL